jgi:hypothetical protein
MVGCIEGELSPDRKVLGSVVLAVAGAFIVEDDVEQAVLDRPVGSRGVQIGLWFESAGRDVEVPGHGGLATALHPRRSAAASLTLRQVISASRTGSAQAVLGPPAARSGRGRPGAPGLDPSGGKEK